MSNFMSNPNRYTAALLTTAVLAAPNVGEAATGGTDFDPTPTPVEQVNHGPCSSPERIKTVSPSCGRFLIRGLRQGSVYDDVSPTLSVASYQKRAKLAVDGDLGPITARSILKGRALNPSSPDPDSRGRELLIDKSEQLAYSLKNGKLLHIFSVSTGTEKPYREVDQDGSVHTGVADTLTGTFKIFSEMSANYRNDRNQPMPYAHYFEGSQGLAVHSGVVDTSGRDSHGCVRVDNSTMVKYIVRQFKLGDKVKIVP